MDELSAEDLQQLEEQLYSEVHHSSNTFSHGIDTGQTTNNSPIQEENIHLNNLLSKRYWKNTNDKTTVNFKTPTEQTNKSSAKMQKVTQLLPTTSTAAHNDENTTKSSNNTKKIRNPFANPLPKQINAKGKHLKLKKHVQRSEGPFVEKLQKLQRIGQLNNKKQKAKNAHERMLKNPNALICVNLDSDNDDEEIIHVPLPPVPVFSVDDSDEDADTVKIIKNELITPQRSQFSPMPVKPANESTVETASRCTSPCSVMSHDDFIGQKDCHRLLGNNEIANDGELSILNSNTDSLLELPTSSSVNKTTNDAVSHSIRRESEDDIECVGTFIKPTTSKGNSQGKDANEQDYRVGETEFRALDVYESETDIVSDGVYTKGSGKPQFPNTSIKSLDNSSGEDVENISQNPTKPKRLRKRRASTNLRGNDSNGAHTSDSEDNEVAATGIPFISRGPAVENHKSKKLRKRTISTGRMSDTEFVATLNSLAQGEPKAIENNNLFDESDYEYDDKVPTAREIAETALKTNNPAQTPKNIEDELPTTSSAAQNESDDDAVPLQIADDIEQLFKKINQIKKKAAVETKHENKHEDIFEVVNEIDESQSIKISDHEENGVKYFVGYSPANNCRRSDGFGWNEEMRRFYNNSWGGERFKVAHIWKSMPRNPSLWRISDIDRFPNFAGRNKREKCLNCMTFGHSRAKCPQPKRPLVCFMCGGSGHSEARCPHTRCLRCGSKTTVFTQSCKKCMYWNNRICPICKLRGHSLTDCPDKWRRYHSTTEPNLYPISKFSYNKKRYCCYCGKGGHLSDECRKSFNKSEYPLISSEIKSHEKSYEDTIRNPYQPPGVACRLLFNPNVNFKFTLAEKTTRNKQYGRFLSAVGLQKAIGAKNEQRTACHELPTVTISGNKLEKTPEQVPEISESKSNKTTIEFSESKANETTAEMNTTNSKNILKAEQQKTSPSNSRLQMPPPPPIKTEQPLPMDVDSDSNYSFSDHFELPSSSSTQNTKTASSPTKISTPPPPRLTDPLPDFIPLGGGNRYVEKPEQDTLETDNSSLKFAISARFVESYSDDEMKIPPKITPTKLPCEAKIYVSDDHHKYFQTKAGQEYLSKIMLENELRGRFIQTIVGYALLFHGLPENQVKLQRQLEIKFKELNSLKATKQNEILQVPKIVEKLKVFLQDSINQLYKNLGSATDLYSRLNELEKQATKNSIKLADRVRRRLNMIFLGQAGLLNGDNHIDTLSKGLRTLTYDYLSTDVSPNELRKEIDTSWRMIFTPYNHKIYSSLMLAYLKITPNRRNRLLDLQIDSKLLGQSVVDVSLSKEQKERLNQYEKNVQIRTEPSLNTNTNIEDRPLLLNVIVPEAKQKPMQNIINNSDNKKTTTINQFENETSNEKTKQQANESDDNISLQNIANETNTEMPTCSNVPKTITTKTIASNIANNENKPENSSIADSLDHLDCQNLLSEIENVQANVNNGNTNDVSNSRKVNTGKVPSEFWSRQSYTFLLELINFAKSSKSKNLERLNQIYKKATDKKLSFNDYSCIIKIYNQAIKK